MKLIGKYVRSAFDSKGNNEVTFQIPKQYSKQLEKLDPDRLLALDIQERTNQRTLEQNNLIWALMGDIDYKQNGRKDKDSVNDLYKSLIEVAMIHVTFCKFDKRALPIFANMYRVVDILREDTHNDVEYISANLYKGSSDFDTKELSQFVETILDYAARVGIEVTYYNDRLKELIENG